MAKVDVTLVNAQDGEEWPAEVVVDKPVGWWLGDILAQLGLPREMGGQHVRYRLLVQRTGRAVTAEETLEAAGLREGDVVRLECEAPRTASVETQLGSVVVEPLAEPAPSPPSAASRAPLIQPVTERAMGTARGFNWRIALLSMAGSVLGGTLAWASYCALMDSYSWSVATFALWAIWYGMWAAVVGPSLKPRRAWGLLAVGTVGCGVLGALIGLFEGEILYSLGWVVVGAIWGLAIAMAYALPANRSLILAALGAFSLGVAAILPVIGLFSWDEIWYAEVVRVEQVFDLLFVLYGLVPGALVGGALGFFCRE
jgi:hypothetical protein